MFAVVEALAVEMIRHLRRRRRASRQAGRLDAGFVFNMPKADPELDGLLVATQPIELAAPTGHPLTKLKQVRLRDLASASFVWFQGAKPPRSTTA
jgi:hypothetical protein